MKNNIYKFFGNLVAISALLGASAASAHGFWFAERSRQLSFIFGVGADDLDATKRVPFVVSFAAFDDEWKKIAASLKINGPLVNVDSAPNPMAVAGKIDYGTWVKTKDGKFYKKGLDEMPEAIFSEHTYKYGVYLSKLNGKVPLLEDQDLQIVPVGDIPALKDKPMTFQVLFHGKPAKGVEFKHDYVGDPDQEGLKTDANGKVKIKIRNQGLNVLGAIYVTPSPEPNKYKQVEHLATLSFVLPHKPE